MNRRTLAALASPLTVLLIEHTAILKSDLSQEGSGIYFSAGWGGLVATTLFVVFSNGFSAGAEVPVTMLVGVKVGITGGTTDAFCLNLSGRLRSLPGPWCALRIERNRASPRNSPAQYLVILVSAVPEPAPNKASVAAPPKAMPAPASFLGS